MASEVRIVVLVGEANGELLDDLSRVSTRARAERLRVLATLGLQSLGQRALVQRDAPPRVRASAAAFARNERSDAVGKAVRAKNSAGPGSNADQDAADTEPVSQRADHSRKKDSTLKKFVKSLG